MRKKFASIAVTPETAREVFKTRVVDGYKSIEEFIRHLLELYGKEKSGTGTK